MGNEIGCGAQSACGSAAVGVGNEIGCGAQSASPAPRGVVGVGRGVAWRGAENDSAFDWRQLGSLDIVKVCRLGRVGRTFSRGYWGQ